MRAPCRVCGRGVQWQELAESACSLGGFVLAQHREPWGSGKGLALQDGCPMPGACAAPSPRLVSGCSGESGAWFWATPLTASH